MTESDFRALRKNAHICRDCGKEDAYTISGRTYCFDCAEKQRLHKQAIRETEEGRNKNRENSKKTRERRKEQGLCERCGKRKHESGMTCCRICLDKMKIAKRERDRAKGVQQRIIGYCVLCGKFPVVEGYKHCVSCLSKKMKVVYWLNESGLADKGRKNREWKRKTERLIG